MYGIVVSLVACALVAVPWHHAMLIRHGGAFWNELFGDNHWRRMVVGRHGDRGTFEYFVRELGYGLLPWIALAPAALGWAVLRGAARRRRRRGAPIRPRRASRGSSWLGAIWFVGGYALVSLSMTKFHHYILPAIPGLAIVIGCFLDDLLARRGGRRRAAVGRADRDPAAGAGRDRSRRHARTPRSASSGCSRTTTSTARRAGRGRDKLDFSARADRVLRGVRAGDGGAGGAARPALGGGRAVACAAIAFTFFLLDGFMRGVTPYWSQKGLIATYYKNAPLARRDA